MLRWNSQKKQETIFIKKCMYFSDHHLISISYSFPCLLKIYVFFFYSFPNPFQKCQISQFLFCCYLFHAVPNPFSKVPILTWNSSTSLVKEPLIHSGLNNQELGNLGNCELRFPGRNRISSTPFNLSPSRLPPPVLPQFYNAPSPSNSLSLSSSH